MKGQYKKMEIIKLKHEYFIPMPCLFGLNGLESVDFYLYFQRTNLIRTGTQN